MKLLELRIERLPGIDGPFALGEEYLGDGLHVVHGPNGCGKSSLVRALRALLWPEERSEGPLQLSARLQHDGHEWLVQRDGGATTWQRDGEPSEPPPLPGVHVADCFTIDLDDLATGDPRRGAKQDEWLAAEILRQTAGGYDLSALRALDVFASTGRRGSNDQRKLREASEKLQRVRREQHALFDEEARLADMEQERDAARQAAARLPLLDRADELAGARSEAAAAESELEQAFPPDMERLHGDELERLAEARRRVAGLETSLRRLEEDEQQLQRRASESRLDVALAAGTLDELRERLATLRERETALDALRREERGLVGELEDSARGLAPDGDPKRLAALEPKGLGVLEELQRKSASLRARIDANDGELSALESLGGAGPASDAAGAGLRVALGLLTLAVAVPALALATLHHIAWLALLAAIPMALFLLRRTTPGGGDSRVERLRASRRDLEKQERELDEERSEACAALGLGRAAGEAETTVIAARIVALGRARRELARSVAEREEIEAQRDELLDAVQRVAVAHGEPDFADAAAAARAVESLAGRDRELRAAREALEGLERERGEHAEGAEAARSEVLRLLQGCGLGPDDDGLLVERLERLDDWRALRKRREDARSNVRFLEHGLAGNPDLLELEPVEIEVQRDVLRQQANEEASCIEKIQDVKTRIAAAGSGHRLQECLAEEEAARERLESVRDAGLVAAAGRFLIDSVAEEHAGKRRPAVLRRADAWFSEFTGRRYQLRVAGGDDAGPARLRAWDTLHRRGLSLGELSSGTRTQLLLAARLAFAADAEHGAPLPLFLDEALDKSDAQRFEAIAASLRTVAREEDRQVVYLSCDPREPERWAFLGEGPDAPRCIDLLRLRRGQSALSRPDVLLRPARGARIVVDGRTLAEVARAIDAPGLDPWVEVGAQHLIHLAGDEGDLPALRLALSLGWEHWGQLRSALEAGGGGVAMFGQEERARLEAGARLLRATLTAWREGRDAPIGRDELEQAGVSERFLDGLSALLRELGGDPRALLDAIDQREDERVKGFRQRPRLELEEFLVESGRISAGEPLEEERAFSRVLETLGGEVKSGALHAEELRTRFERIWGLCSLAAGETLAEPSAEAT